MPTGVTWVDGRLIRSIQAQSLPLLRLPSFF